MEDEIFELIGRLITMLQDVAIDERHTPRLYAQFLASLLTGHRKGGGSVVGHAESLGNIESGTCKEHSCMYILAEGYLFPLTGLGVVSVICSECTSRLPVKMCVSDLIHPGFFILRIYALWNKNRNLLAAMLSVFFVSSQSTHHTMTSSKCISQAFVIASLIIYFTASVPMAGTCFHLPSGVPRLLKASVHFHRYDWCDPGHHRVLQQY
jgi:hypothetical protein